MQKFFGVFGNPISHSKSPIIYNNFFKKFGLKECYYTRIFASDSEEVVLLSKKLKLSGANITSPFKKDITKFCDKLDCGVQQTDSANTLYFTDEQIISYNTDIFGIQEEIFKANVDFEDKKIAIIGAGGAAATIIYVIQNLFKDADITILNRTTQNAKDLSHKFNVKFIENEEKSYKNLQQFDIVFVAIPQFNDFLKNIKIKKNAIIFIANYSDKSTILHFQQVHNKVVPCYNWLFYQAIKSFQIFFNNNKIDIKNDDIMDILQELPKNLSKNNIYLSGFSGSGKTTLAPILSEKLGINYVDLDKMIESELDMSIEKIFSKYGENYFRSKESEYLEKTALDREKKIIALGAGVLDNDKNRNLIRRTGYNIYLYSNLETCLQRIDLATRPVLHDMKEKEASILFDKRFKKYLSSSDLVFPNSADNDVERRINQLVFEVKQII